MPYQVQLDTGHTLEFDQEPTQDMIQQASNHLYGQEENKPGMLAQTAGAIGQGVAMGGLNVLKGASLLAGGAASAVGAKGAAEDFFEAVRQENEGGPNAYGPKIKQFFQEQGASPGGNFDKASNLISGITSLASPGSATLAMGGGASETMDKLQEQGVDADTAKNIAEGQFGFGLAAGAFLPGGAVRTALANVGQGVAARAATNEYLKREGYTAQAEQQPGALDTESMVNDAVFGAVAGKLLGGKPKAEPSQGELKTGADIDQMLKENPEAGTENMGPDVNAAMARNPYNLRGTVGETELPPGGSFAREEPKMFSGRPLTEEEKVVNAEQAKDPNLQSSDKPRIGPPREINADLFWNDYPNALRMDYLMDEQGKIRPQDAIEDMKESPYQHIRQAANMLDRFPGLMQGLEIQVQKGMFDGFATKEGTGAQYSPLNHRIEVGEDWVNDHLLVHEMVHAVTSRALIMSDTMPGVYPKMDALRKSLDNILQEVRSKAEEPGKVMQTNGQEAFAGKYPNEMPGVAHGRIYGLTNIDEMLSEAWANRNFRELLDKVNVWDRLKSSVKQFLGMPGTALDKVLNITQQIGDLHEQARDTISQRLQTAAPNLDVRQLNAPMREAADAAIKKGLHEDKTLDVLDKTPGLRGISEKYIPEAPKPEDIISQALTEKDLDSSFGSKIVQNFTVSAEQYANLARSKAVYMAARIYDRGQKLAHFYEDSVVTPLREGIKRTIPDSSWKELKTIKDLMIKEDFANKRLNPDQLGKVLNERQQKVYQMVRKARDDQLTFVNEKRLQQGLDPIKPRDAYATSHWSGPWKAEIHTTIRDAEGKVKLDKEGKAQTKMTGIISGHSIAEVQKGIDHVLGTSKDHSATKPEYKKTFSTTGKDYLQAYEDLSRILGKDDPAVQAVQRAIEMYHQKEGMSTQDYLKHFEQKSGARYFEGDRPWVDPRKDTQDWYRNQLDNLHEGYKWGAMQEATGNMKKVVSDPQMIKQRPNMVEYLKQYSRNQLGFGKLDYVSNWENDFYALMGGFVNTIPGIRNIPVDMRTGMSLMRNAKNLIYLKALGFWKPQHFLVNGLFQPAFAIPRHMKLSAEGYSHNMLQTVTSGIRDAQAILLDHYMRGKGPELTPFARDMANYLKTNQIATNNPFSDVGELGRSRVDAAIKTSQAFGGFFMQEGERVARVNAFVSFAHHLEQSGKFSDQNELFREAERHTTETMGSFRHTDRPMFFTKMGLVGTGLATLRQFEINFINQFHDYAKYAGETKNYGPLLAMSGIQLAYAGVLGFVGMETVDQIWRWFRDMVPNRLVSKEFAQWSPKAAILKHLPLEASRGLVSPWSGINFASSLEAGTIVDPSLEGLFPFISEVKNTIEPAWNYMSDPSKDNLHKFIYNEMPYGMRGTLETGKFAGMQLPESLNTKPWFTSPSGVISSANKPGEGVYTRGQTQTAFGPASEENIRSWGFASGKEAITKEAQQMSKENDKMLGERQLQLVHDMDSAIRNHDLDNMTDYIQKYIELSGDPRQIMTNGHLHELIMKWNTDYQQQIALGTKNYEGIMKYQRLQQYLQQIGNYYGHQR